AGEAHSTRFALVLDTRRYVDAVTEDVVAFDDDITDIDADTKRNVRSVIGGPRPHAVLDLSGAGDGVDDTGKFDQQAIAHRLEDASFMTSDCGINDTGSMRFQGPERPHSINAH